MKCFRKISALIIAGVMGITYTCCSVPVYAWSREYPTCEVPVFRLTGISVQELPNKSGILMETVTSGAVQETDNPIITEMPVDATNAPSEIVKPDEVQPTKGVPTQIPFTSAPDRTLAPEITFSPIQTKPPAHTQLPIKTPSSPTFLPVCTLTPVATKKPGSTNIQDPATTAKPPSDGEGYCQITYQLNGGKNHKNNPIKVKKKGVSVVLNAPSKAKYTFVGWYTDARYTHKVTTVGNTSLSFLTLYAKWKRVTVKQVKFSMVKKKGTNSIFVKVERESGVKGFEYVYAKDSSFKRKFRLRTKRNPKTLSKLMKKKKYYIKVRAYKLDSTGKKIYGTYSRVKKVKL